MTTAAVGRTRCLGGGTDDVQRHRHGDRLSDFLKPVSALVDECKLHLNVDGLRIAAVDPANVAMVDATLDAGWV